MEKSTLVNVDLPPVRCDFFLFGSTCAGAWLHVARESRLESALLLTNEQKQRAHMIAVENTRVMVLEESDINWRLCAD